MSPAADCVHSLLPLVSKMTTTRPSASSSAPALYRAVPSYNRRPQVQLRNSRAALAADRRVWLLERQEREAVALSKVSPAPPERHPRLETSPLRAESEPKTDKSKRTDGSADRGRAARVRESIPPLLEGLRPECEAVMRALFCRVDRCGGWWSGGVLRCWGKKVINESLAGACIHMARRLLC